MEGGAYIDGETLVMPDGSSAVFRYVQWGETPAAAACAEGAGQPELLADEQPLKDAGAGLHEIRIISHGDLKVTSVSFQ